MNLLITPAQAIGHKIPDLETSSRILQKSGNKKMMSFWKKLLIGSLVCIKTCYSFKPAKPFNDQKYKSQNRDTLKSPWLMPWGTLIENYLFLENFSSHNPPLLTEMISATFWTITLFLADINRTLLSHTLSLDKNDMNNP